MMTHGVKFKFEDVKEYVEITSNSGCTLVSTEYVGANDKLDFKCVCGKPFTAKFSKFMHCNKRTCNECTYMRSRARNQHSREQVEEYLKTKGYELISDEYINTDIPIIIKDELGYMYNVYLYNIKTGQNVNKVDSHNPFTIDNIKLWCKLNEKPFELLSETYIDNRSPLVWKCLKDNCQKEFITSWTNLGRDTSCNICSDFKQGLYKGEKKIKKILSQFNIEFTQQMKFPDCKKDKPLAFDFYLPNYNTCIEFQGQQHYYSVEFFGGDKNFKNQQIRDQIKRDYCKANNIRLLEIGYFDFDDIEDILYTELKISQF